MYICQNILQMRVELGRTERGLRALSGMGAGVHLLHKESSLNNQPGSGQFDILTILPASLWQQNSGGPLGEGLLVSNNGGQHQALAIRELHTSSWAEETSSATASRAAVH
jgi:hypothetical protein